MIHSLDRSLWSTALKLVVSGDGGLFRLGLENTSVSRPYSELPSKVTVSFSLSFITREKSFVLLFILLLHKYQFLISLFIF